MRSRIFTCLLAGLLAAGCSPKYYTPNTQNVPLLHERGQTNLTLSGNGSQAEFQGALALTDHVGIQVNGGLFIPKDLDNGDGGSGSFIEGGAGYFLPVGTNFVFETYGLFGFGGVENHFPSSLEANPSTDGKISANVARYGVQPSFGYFNKYFSVAVSSRICGLNYSKIDGYLVFDGRSEQDYLFAHRSTMLVEPALTIRGGLKKLKLQLQCGGSFNLSNPALSRTGLL